jgi:hypothetical protein
MKIRAIQQEENKEPADVFFVLHQMGKHLNGLRQLSRLDDELVGS